MTHTTCKAVEFAKRMLAQSDARINALEKELAEVKADNVRLRKLNRQADDVLRLKEEIALYEEENALIKEALNATNKPSSPSKEVARLRKTIAQLMGHIEQLNKK